MTHIRAAETPAASNLQSFLVARLNSFSPDFSVYHMSEPQITNLRKRQYSELPQRNGYLQTQSKKRKLHDHSTEFELCAAFWDNLSRIWLTKRALRELDRRNAQFDPSNTHCSLRRSQRPVTPRGLSILQKNDWRFQSAGEVLLRCTPACIKRIKSFARHGGPDLSDLKGVCIMKYLLILKLIIYDTVSGTHRPFKPQDELNSVQSRSKTRFNIYPYDQIHNGHQKNSYQWTL